MQNGEVMGSYVSGRSNAQKAFRIRGSSIVTLPGHPAVQSSFDRPLYMDIGLGVNSTLTTQQKQDSFTSYRSNVPDDGHYLSIQDFLVKEPDFDHSEDTGHPWRLDRRNVFLTPTAYLNSCSIHDPNSGRVFLYSGPVYPSSIQTSGTLSPVGDSVVSRINVSQPFEDIPTVDMSLGARAIHGSAPDRPDVSVSSDILEMFSGDVSPRMAGRSILEIFTHRRSNLVSGTSKAVGDEYLNWVFGFVPDLGDLKTLIQVLSSSTKRITQYYSDSNKFVRRKFYYPPVQTYDAGTIPLDGATGIIPGFVDSGAYSNWPSNQLKGSLITSRPSAGLSLLVERSAITNTWFHGQFLYSLAVGRDLLSRMARWGQVIDKLTGTRLTLESFYNAVPYSWMLDWVTDIGDIIANATRSEFNNEILRYGYLMDHVRVQKTYTIVGPFTFANGYKVSDLSITYVTEKKERVRATPFGFGIDPGTFSASQLAILAALGISKGQGLPLPGKFGSLPRY
jgi:hypothetical protein